MCPIQKLQAPGDFIIQEDKAKKKLCLKACDKLESQCGIRFFSFFFFLTSAEVSGLRWSQLLSPVKYGT